MFDTFKTKKYLTVEDAIKVIIGLIPESQLKKLEIVGTSGRKVTAENQLSLVYKHKYCKYQTESEIRDVFDVISSKQELNFWGTFFDEIFQEDNPEQNSFIKDKQWKQQQIHNWINSFGILLTFLTSIIVPIILKYV